MMLILSSQVTFPFRMICSVCFLSNLIFRDLLVFVLRSSWSLWIFSSLIPSFSMRKFTLAPSSVGLENFLNSYVFVGIPSMALHTLMGVILENFLRSSGSVMLAFVSIGPTCFSRIS